jgi:uncharacterized glyoxalase superfamily protein PhnB
MRSSWKSPSLVPDLAYDEPERAIDWLCRVYGFVERRAARLSFPGGLRAWLELEGALVCVTTPGHGLVSPRKLGGRSQALKLYVGDVDAHHARAKACGAEIESEPSDGFWGGRIYRTLDLEGHAFEFSQAGVDLAAEDWKLPPGVRRGA